MFSRDNGLPELQNLLYPRFPSFVQAASLLASLGFPNIYNVTILYYRISPETGKKDFESCSTPTLQDFVMGKFSKDTWHVAVSIEKVSLPSLGMSRRNLEKWLEKTWYTKDSIISNYMAQDSEVKPAKEEFNVVKEPHESKRLFHRKRRHGMKTTSTSVSDIEYMVPPSVSDIG